MTNIRKAFKALGATLMIAVFGLGTMTLSACSSTSNSVTLNTKDAQRVLAAAAFAAKAVEALPVIQDKVPAASLKDFDQAVADVQAMAASAVATSGGSVTLTLSKTWPQDLLKDMQTIIKIAQPIVHEFLPSADPYISTVSQLIPLIQTFLPADALAVHVAGPVYFADGSRLGAPASVADMVKAKASEGTILKTIYLGPVYN